MQRMGDPNMVPRAGLKSAELAGIGTEAFRRVGDAPTAVAMAPRPAEAAAALQHWPISQCLAPRRSMSA
jgi:hypothetical protein